MREGQVLVVDDEPEMRRVLQIMLRKMGFESVAAGDGAEALAVLRDTPADLVITDLRMPRMDGLALLEKLRAGGSDVPVIVITAHGSVESAVEAMQRGASDYLLRPFDIDVLELAVQRSLQARDLQRQNEFLREEVDRGWGGFVGRSPRMRAVYELIRRVAPTDAAVFVTGETGTGKELAARALHAASQRADRLFVPVNCAAIPADVLESELFGYVKGAFTGAVRDRVGKFELADGGTLFLDEITEMPLALQAKLLRVLDDGRLERLGSNATKTLDIRVVAATNLEPEAAMRDGRLRADLHFRLNVVRVDLPPLRERKEDLPALVAHFVQRFGRDAAHVRLTTAAQAILVQHDWPGNVRELENAVERALILSDGPELGEELFGVRPAARAESRTPMAVDATMGAAGALAPAVEQLERSLIANALQQSDGSKPRAAALLDISERTLWYKIKKYRLGE